MSRLTLIVTPRGNVCPLTCDYCYNADPYLKRSECDEKMTEELLEILLKRFFSYSQSRYEIIWHGGEPLLAGVSFYKRVVQLQQEISKRLGISSPVANHIQTNGILLSKDWVDFFKEHDFKVGLSIDGPAGIHNAHRKYPSGRGSHADAMRGALLLKEAGISIGVGAVVTKESLDDPIGLFEYMRQHFSVFDFSPCFTAITEEGVWTQEITPLEYAKFVTTVFDHWFEMDNPKIRIRTFRHYIEAALGYTPRTCSMAAGCHKFMSVGGEGNVYPCGRLHGVPQLQFGTILNQEFTEIQSRRDYQTYMELAHSQSNDCLNCKWQYACHNGCTASRYTEGGEILPKTPFCEATQVMLTHISQRVSQVTG